MSVSKDDDPMEAVTEEYYEWSFDEHRPERTFLERTSISLTQAFQPVYNYIFTGRGQLVNRLELQLAQAKINRPVELYLTNVIAIGLLFGLGMGVVTVLLLIPFTSIFYPTPGELFHAQDLWLQVVSVVLDLAIAVIAITALFVVFSSLGLVAGYLFAVYYPKMPIYRRQREINRAMPDLTSFMYSLSVSGMDTLNIFEVVAESEDTLGEVAVEFRDIDHQMKNFNINYQSAIENVADETPSDELSKFLVDMMSIIDSGGSMSQFLETKKEYHIAEQRRTMEEDLEVMEMMGEIYTTLTVLPLILLVILVIMALLGEAQMAALFIIVYFAIPALNLFYGVTVSAIMENEIGTGVLEDNDGRAAKTSTESGFMGISTADEYLERNPDSHIFSQIRSFELRHQIKYGLSNPIELFRKSPLYTLLWTVPLAALAVLFLLLQGVADPSLSGIQQDAFVQTIVWFCVPFLVISLPLSFFYEWRAQTIGSITDSLTEDLRKLANTNATGKPLLESIRITGEDNPTRLGQEFKWIYKRVQFGSSLGTVLIEFNNRYQIPRLARSVQLIQKANEASSEITNVLKTAAELSEIEDELVSERKSRAQMQVVIIIFSFLVFIAVLLMLQEFFIDAMVEIIDEDAGEEWGDFDNIQPDVLSMLYFHAALIQGLCAGFISGYVQSGDKYSGIKYAIALVLVTIFAWGVVGAVL